MMQLAGDAAQLHVGYSTWLQAIADLLMHSWRHSVKGATLLASVSCNCKGYTKLAYNKQH
jgi:hypothetical protein